MLEGLTKYWGFYLVAAPDVNGAGVRGLEYALSEVASYEEWVSGLQNVNIGERVAQGVNIRITSSSSGKS